MFHKIFVFMLLAGFAGVANARDDIEQVVTSEVFFDRSQQVEEQESYVQPVKQVEEVEEVEYAEDVPVWPLAGSEADVEIVCGEKECTQSKKGLVIENNINMGWSGGPNIMAGSQIPTGFDYECANNVEMPLLRREMMEDDGGSVLAMSRSSRRTCNKTPDAYAVFAERAGFQIEETCNNFENKPSDESSEIQENVSSKEMAVNEYVDEEAPAKVQDQVRSWVVANGQTLREVLQAWCDKEGWDLVWTTSREYPIEASAVFKGRFVDVASALVRNFERATPIPYAKFYKGNRVLVISTTEE